MSRVAEHQNIEIHDTSSGYTIYFVNPHDPGETQHARGMGDGVDQYEDAEGNSIFAGTEEFNEALQKDLEANYEQFMEAYAFDRVYPRQARVSIEVIKTYAVTVDVWPDDFGSGNPEEAFDAEEEAYDLQSTFIEEQGKLNNVETNYVELDEWLAPRAPRNAVVCPDCCGEGTCNICGGRGWIVPHSR